MSDADLYYHAVEKWGPTPQWRQLQEECGELVAAINRFDRLRITEQELAEEVADVEIMVEQARIMLGDAVVDEAKQRKLDRLRERLRDA